MMPAARLSCHLPDRTDLLLPMDLYDIPSLSRQLSPFSQISVRPVHAHMNITRLTILSTAVHIWDYFLRGAKRQSEEASKIHDRYLLPTRDLSDGQGRKKRKD